MLRRHEPAQGRHHPHPHVDGIGDAVYIGDTQGDLEASRKAGIPFIFCTYGFGTPETFDAKIDAFTDLPELLETM